MIISFVLVRKQSRRNILIMTDVISIVGVLVTMISAMVRSIPILFVGRAICGIGTGLNSTLVPIYIKEISPDALCQKTSLHNLAPIYNKDKGLEEISGKTGALHYLMVSVGVLFSTIFGYIVDDRDVNLVS